MNTPCLGHDSAVYKDEGSSESLTLQWMTLYGWVMAVVLYCTVIVVVVSVRLIREQVVLEDTPVTEKPLGNLADRQPRGSEVVFKSLYGPRPFSTEVDITRQREMHGKMTTIVRRIVLYTLIPVCTQTGNVIVAMSLYFTGRASYGLLMWSYVGTSMQGLLNFGAFCFDPAVLSALDAYLDFGSNKPIYGPKIEASPPGTPTTPPEAAERPRNMSVDSLAAVPLPAMSSWRMMATDDMPMAPGATYASMSPTVANPESFGATYSSINLSTGAQRTEPFRDREESVDLWDGSPIQVGMETIEFDPSFRHL